MSYKNEHLLPILFVENTRLSLGYVCVFRLDYQQNLSIFIDDIDYLKWYKILSTENKVKFKFIHHSKFIIWRTH